MNRQSYKINITAKNANEIYNIYCPDNLINFISFDLTPFMDKCVEICRTNMKMGRVNHDEVSSLKSLIIPCHTYLEKNIHGTFEKIVIDCWIEYICRQNKIDESTLWDSFSSCRNGFESALFTRLCEYRYHRGINQWTNLVKIQEYTRQKVEFIFGKRLQNRSVAIAHAGYFDLIFNVAANEMGCGELSTSRIYSGLRTPNSPFLMTKMSRNIMQKILPELDVDEGIPDFNDSCSSDKPAMEVFAAIKDMIPIEPDSLISANSIMRIPQRVYIPEGLKSVIDLEIDVLLENDAVIQKCERCHEYFLKDADYNYNYCSRLDKGQTCLEISGEKTAVPASELSTVDTSVLHARCDQLYKEMSERVNVDINQRDFSDWYKYLTLIRENVISGLASMDDFENFAEYSHTISFASRRNHGARKTYSAKEKGDDGSAEPKREVRAFEFERIERKPQNPYSFPSPPPLPLSVPIPYAPTKTARVIRGVAPMGFKDLSQNHEVVPVPDFSFAQPEQPLDLTLPKTDGFETVKEFKKVGQPEKVVTNLSSPKKAKKTTEGRPKTRIDKYGKGLLLKNPYESNGMLQNPYIRDLIKPDDVSEIGLEEEPENANTVTPSKLETPVTNIPSLNIVPDVRRSENPSDFGEITSLPLFSLDEPDEPEAPQLDFSHILTGIQRNDSFDGGNPTDSGEETVLSHKTKRVMDTVFGKSEIVNPFVKAGENED
ncbi:MAG: hypothetical protein FWG33_00325 [Oscillospiraceae bacterium]|nr:hypothetical protein [Oscillospiraceae bacterium]